ncbi:hypothetical protein CEXT_52011 [Caerostris extrusa]|uniref:Secreted protein n=1 Tax=Caerostris extrusa TaxID=172846 RepID=A0AAV4PUV2_CAEEX|nr:hypothetical protein CEXT_52011 [Caerostris extrusa]
MIFTVVKLLHLSITMIAKVAFLCAALAAVRASGLIGALSSTLESALLPDSKQDVLGNNAFGCIKDGLGATNSPI